MRRLFLLLAAIQLHANIQVVYHIAMMNNWEAIVKEQLERLESTGFGDAFDAMTVTVVGPKKFFPKVEALFKAKKFRKKVQVIYAGRDLALYEFPAIEMVQEIARHSPEANILYMHNKGVTHYGKVTEKPSRLWRRYMEYFAIDRWKDCIEALKTSNACGVDLALSAHSHLPFFGGNIWWGRGDYLATCTLFHNSRYDCENFIGTGLNFKPTTFHQSGENPQLTWVTYPSHPEYFAFDPTKSPYHKGILNLYSFPYLEEYYKK
jgi:hypothetical protein